MLDWKDTDGLQSLVCFSGQRKLRQGRAQSGEEGGEIGSGDLCKGTCVSLPSHCRLTGGGSVAAGAGVQMGPRKHCAAEHTAFDILSPCTGSVSPFAPSSLMPGRRLEGFSCENNLAASSDCAH